MNDAKLARRMRISNVLMAAWLLVVSYVVALLVGEILAGVLTAALMSLGWAVGVLWTNQSDLLPGGRLADREKRVLQVASPVAFGLGFCAAVLGWSNADLAAWIVAAVAGTLAFATGAFSIWLAVR